MGQKGWDEGVFASTGWLYDLHVASQGYGVIHIPLLYLTKLRVQQELYAGSLVEFPLLMGLSSSFQPFVLDGSVVKFPLQSYENFRANCFGVISNSEVLQKNLARQMIALRKWLPLFCLKAEKNYLSRKKVSPVLLKRLHRMLIRAVALNLLNPFVQIVFMKANRTYSNDKSYQEMVDRIVWPKIFSHMAYIEEEEKKLIEISDDGTIDIDDILDYCWTKAFLKNNIGDGSELESPVYLAQQLYADHLADLLAGRQLKTDQLKMPEINFDPAGLTDKWVDSENNLERILLLLRFLQVNEEFRHYWGLRVIRLFRLIAPDKESREGWSISDYEEYCKKQ